MPEDRDKTSFRGPFSLHLFNLLRTIRRSKQTVAVRVYVESDEGTIYFDKGKLVHAESGGLTGEEAFKEIVLMRDGSYEKITDLSADVVSIERDIKALLAETKEAKEQGKEEKQYVLTLVEEIETGVDEKIGEIEKAEGDKVRSRPVWEGDSTSQNYDVPLRGPQKGGEGVSAEPLEQPSPPQGPPQSPPQGKSDAASKSSQAQGEWQPKTELTERGFQEELWMTDWGQKTPGFIAARIVREDGVSIMRALETKEELSPQVTKNVIDAAKQFAGDLQELLMESKNRLYSISLLADGYYLVLALDRSRADLGALEERLTPLIKALKESLELA